MNRLKYLLACAAGLCLCMTKGQAQYWASHKEPYHEGIWYEGDKIISSEPYYLSFEARELLEKLYPEKFKAVKLKNTLGTLGITLGAITFGFGVGFYTVELAMMQSNGGFFPFEGIGLGGTVCLLSGAVLFTAGEYLLHERRKNIRDIVKTYHREYGPDKGRGFKLSTGPTRHGLGLMLEF